MTNDKVLEELRVINHQAKNIKWIRNWLWVCDDPDHRYAKFKNQCRYGSPLDCLDQAAYVHYDIELHSAANIGYGISMPTIWFAEMIESGKYSVEDSYREFVYPECDREAVRNLITQDYEYIYFLKEKCLEHFLENAEKENVNAMVISRGFGGDRRKKKVGVEIIENEKKYRYHMFSDSYFDLHPELPVDANDHREKFKIYDLSKIEVENAIKTVEEFLKSRNGQ